MAGFKKGVPLKTTGAEERLLAFLRDNYSITTAEELVEALSFSDQLAGLAMEVVEEEAWVTLVKAARATLSNETIEQLETSRNRFGTGALKP